MAGTTRVRHTGDDFERGRLPRHRNEPMPGVDVVDGREDAGSSTPAYDNQAQRPETVNRPSRLPSSPTCSARSQQASPSRSGPGSPRDERAAARAAARHAEDDLEAILLLLLLLTLLLLLLLLLSCPPCAAVEPNSYYLESARRDRRGGPFDQRPLCIEAH